MFAQNKRLTILSEEERFALYELPDFNEIQQNEYLILTDREKQMVFSRLALSTQVYCALQIGYFKAKQMFFDFDWNDIPPEDIAFLMKNYWTDQEFSPQPITKYEYYIQIKEIVKLYDYSLWSKKYTELLFGHILKTSRRDISIGFILTELLQFIQNERIVRPGYTTLQDIISTAINSERERLGNLIIKSLKIFF